MSFLNNALKLASQGFHVFPLRPDSKLPAIKDFPNQASRNPDKIRSWWLDPVLEIEKDYNVGISTSKFKDEYALIVIDVDNKGTKKGDDSLLTLEMEGKDLPATFTQSTPTGGKHLVYWHVEPVRNGVNRLGDGLDIRSSGGYIVGAGSCLGNGEYTVEVDPGFSPAPAWLVSACGQAPEKKSEPIEVEFTVDQTTARDRAIYYLENEAPEAAQGGRNHAGYVTACRLKDFGVDEANCFSIMFDHWQCSPMLEVEELEHVISSAYRYGTEAPGAASPEAQFSPVVSEGTAPVVHFLHAINQDHALIYVEGSHFILHETVDEEGRPKRVFLNEPAFKRKFSPFTVQDGKHVKTQAQLWLDWANRRSYAGICFAPEREARNGYYNLWRGFTCLPLAYDEAGPKQRQGLDMFLAHAKENVCQGDEALFQWLMGYFAHMVQRPYERPLTTLVFRGAKGTGKNTLIDRVGNLLGREHYLVAQDGRYLTSNFNGHMDSCLCLVLDEAFWSGDKGAEGKLKGLTTSPTIMIERKGKEPYTVDNLVRLVVIGNDEWLVPASADERRYAVFNIGDGKKQNRKYFHDMRVFLDDEGGNRVLLHYLQNFDLSKVDVNAAPETQGLLEQKLESLDLFGQWWLGCLTDGYVSGTDFGNNGWGEVGTSEVRASFFRFCRERNVRSRLPSDRELGAQIKKLANVGHKQKMKDGQRQYVYAFPSLSECRNFWEKYIGQSVQWE